MTASNSIWLIWLNLLSLFVRDIRIKHSFNLNHLVIELAINSQVTAIISEWIYPNIAIASLVRTQTQHTSDGVKHRHSLLGF